jgi:hypothetical protein
MAFQRMVKKNLPVALVGAGLPSVSDGLFAAKGYSDRLFSHFELGRLSRAAARSALVGPAGVLGVEYDHDAAEHILDETDGYPYFIQEFGRVAWNECEQSPVGIDVVQVVRDTVRERLADEFYGRRLNQGRCSRRLPKRRNQARPRSEATSPSFPQNRCQITTRATAGSVAQGAHKMADHTFQTAHVEPLPLQLEEASKSSVVLRVAPGDAERIVRALDQASLNLAPAPGGSRGAGVYRRLAADIRLQANNTLAGSGSTRKPFGASDAL